MFVGSTFLSILDRTSPNTLLTGRTGSSLGLLGTIIFVVVSFVIFIGPIIYYFKGDYIQGTFNSYKFQATTLYTGVDFKLAIMFRNKKTNELVNHTKMTQIYKTKGYYFSPTQVAFYSDVKECNDQYFSEMQNKKDTFRPQDCFIIPNNVAYYSEYHEGASSVIGFIMDPECRDPFSCTFQSTTEVQINTERLKFFAENYYVVYFSGEKIDQWGNKKQQFYEMYSTEFEAPIVKTSIIYIVFGTEKYHMDNSIMPWYNNDTIMLSAWRGKTSGIPLGDNSLLASGVGTFIAYDNFQSINYREYKKLDWLLGMLGGGIFIIYLIIWVPCKHISLIKSKIETAETTTLIRNDNRLENVEKPSFGLLWKISTLLPWNMARFKKQNKTIFASQKLLDAADLVKKLKVTSRNLARTNHLKRFEPRRLDFDNYNIKEQWTQSEMNEEIKKQEMEALKSSQKISEICSNHLPMLRLCDMQNPETEKKATQLMEIEDNFSKLKVRKFQDKNKSKCHKACDAIKNGAQKAFTFFDVFGAKPNLLGSPENFSMFGCLTGFLIIVLSVLTFSLTIHNMKVVRPYWDSIYKSPAEQNLTLVGGVTFKLAVCFSSAYINSTYLVGSDRVADIKFFQYTRNGKEQQEQLFTGYRLNQAGSTYFDIRDPSFQISLYYCTAVQDGRNYSIYGNSQTEKQAYIGAKIVPYCGKGEQQCLNQTVTQQRIKIFTELISRFPIMIVAPEANYYPEEGKVMSTPIPQPISLTDSSVPINITGSVEMAISVDTLQIIDNYQTWTMGPFPQAKQKYLSTRYDGMNTKLSTKPGDLSLTIKLASSGVVDRVVFHSTKIDMLLATIGGIFVFFWFCFSCFSKFYNHYSFKAKLAEVLYTQESEELSKWKIILQWLRIPCCSDRVMRKVEQDIQNVNIAKKVDNVYRLSVCQLEREEEKNLALIYLKERIKSDETVAKVDDDESDSEQGDDDFEGDWEIQKALQNKRQSSNAVQNSSEIDENKEIIVQKEHSPFLKNMQPEIVEERVPNTNKKCSYLYSFDLFNSNSQLTLDGKRSVQSVCGGICCLVLFVFLCVLTSHFLTVYFSNWHRVSFTKMTEQDSETLRMDFTVGENIKLAMSFWKFGDYGFQDVSSLASDLDLLLVKYLVTSIGGVVTTKNESIRLVQCERSTLNGFIGEDEDKDYYNDWNKAYCVPDGTKLSLYGNTGDKQREYFSFRIDNGETNTNLTKLDDLFKKYIPRYHISEPILDYNADGDLRYKMRANIKAPGYQSFSTSFNVTFTKNVIQYDTAVNPSNERPSMTTYEMSSQEAIEYGLGFSDAGLQERYSELNFYTQDCLNKIMIQTIKVNELFGIIGGCIIFLFFGIGCIPRSYNQFKMRYILGSKLYIVMGQKRISKPKHKGGKKIEKKVFGEEILFSEWSLMQAWLLSFFGFMRNNFNFSQVLRYAALIQSRVTQDINTFDLLKALYACQSSINQLKLLENDNVNLCRIFPKQIVPVEENESKECKDMIQIIKNQFSPLVDATRVNKFSDWELKTIILAKNANVNFADIFNEKWLDRLIGLDRSSMGSIGGRSSYTGYRKTNYFNNRQSNNKSHNRGGFEENESESDSASMKGGNKIGKMRRESRKNESKVEIESQGQQVKKIEGIEGESFSNLNNMDIE